MVPPMKVSVCDSKLTAIERGFSWTFGSLLKQPF